MKFKFMTHRQQWGILSINKTLPPSQHSLGLGLVHGDVVGVLVPGVELEFGQEFCDEYFGGTFVLCECRNLAMVDFVLGDLDEVGEHGLENFGVADTVECVVVRTWFIFEEVTFEVV